MKTFAKTLCAVVLAAAAAGGVAAETLKRELHSGWKFKQERLTSWYAATVPGVVHTDLMANGIIEDPFFRLNERAVQWVDKEDWRYETRFDVSSDMRGKRNIRLHFMGLDTYADVYLNGEKVLTANNMFREWKVDVKGRVKAKDNKLEVLFKSPIKTDIPKFDALPYKYPTGPDQSENGGIFNKTVSIFARKAGYHYGWDWGPRLVTSGIWRPVLLEAWDDVRIENVFIQQKKVTQQRADIAVNTEILADGDYKNVTLTVRAKPTPQCFDKLSMTAHAGCHPEPVEGRGEGKAGEVVFGTKTFDVKKGLNTLSVEFFINNPKLWWCNGLGKPDMYEFQTELEVPNPNRVQNPVRVSHTTVTGIRSIKVVNKPDKDGTAFYFELNGVRVFAKGANYIPSDNFLPRVTKEAYEKTVLDAVNANMNMLRVWGGGTYEEDVFYDLCDRYGIMVWQDFMFACSMYPSEGEYLENVKHEAIDNIKRLRNHPSISIWCGNNEAYDGWFGWGRKEDYTRQNPEYARVMWRQYVDLFHKLLPDMVAEHAPEAFYHPSSPYGLPGKGCDDKNGDRHYWDVWHGRKPIAQYNVERSRFFSEYGFQSFPEFESIKIYAPKPEDWAITSEVMMDHQRAGDYANKLIEEYLLNEYQKPKDFESFLYMNQVLQGDAIKIAMEAHRRDMPYCMGTLFWQHNDCWPVASWSSRDYYGRWKAQHYFAREAYRDILVSPIADNKMLNIFIVSDRLTATEGTLKIKVAKLDGTTLSEETMKVKVPANTSTLVGVKNLLPLLKGANKKDVFVTATFTGKSGKAYRNTCFLLQQKDINFPVANITRSVKNVADGVEVTLQSDKLARAVFMSIDGIDNFFENNYFDLLPNEKLTVKVKTSLSKEEFEKQLKVVSLRDAY